MNEDIVYELRYVAEKNRGGFNVALYERAADEIERLRTENRAVKDAYEHLAEISKSQRETMTKYLFPQEEQQ